MPFKVDGDTFSLIYYKTLICSYIIYAYLVNLAILNQKLVKLPSYETEDPSNHAGPLSGTMAPFLNADNI